MKPTLKPPGTKRLKLGNDGPHSKYDFKFTLRRYNQVALAWERVFKFFDMHLKSA